MTRVGRSRSIATCLLCIEGRLDVFHEDAKGTQGPGHFTVRPCGPHYRAHPLRFSRFPGKAAQEIQEMQEIQDGGFAGRALAARSVLRSPFSVLRGGTAAPQGTCVKRVGFGKL